MESRGLGLLRLGFLIGVTADTLVAINWFLIASGFAVPNYMCGFSASSQEYRFAMYIAALFMAGWTVILAWGWQRPFERKGLLLITAVMLLVSILLELTFYGSLLGGRGFALGVGLRLALVVKFTVSYVYSRESLEVTEP